MYLVVCNTRRLISESISNSSSPSRHSPMEPSHRDLVAEAAIQPRIACWLWMSPLASTAVIIIITAAAMTIAEIKTSLQELSTAAIEISTKKRERISSFPLFGFGFVLCFLFGELCFYFFSLCF
ncbi:hypothetical protein GQ457_18G007160 [Hibiscus cannabinus]